MLSITNKSARFGGIGSGNNGVFDGPKSPENTTISLLGSLISTYAEPRIWPAGWNRRSRFKDSGRFAFREEQELLELSKFVQTKIADKEWDEISTGSKLEKYVVQEGDWVILTSGDHMGLHGGTNKIKVVQVGNVV